MMHAKLIRTVLLCLCMLLTVCDATAQAADMEFSGDALKMTVTNAAFDGSYFSMTCTLESLLPDTRVYVLYEWDEDMPQVGGGSSAGFDQFYEPLEVMNGKIDMEIHYDAGTALPVSLNLSVLQPTDAYLPYDSGDCCLSTEMWNEIIAPIPFDGDTLAQLLVRTGMFTLVEEIPVRFTLPITDERHSLLPNGNVVLETETYTLRITRADISSSAFSADVWLSVPIVEGQSMYDSPYSIALITSIDVIDGSYSWESMPYPDDLPLYEKDGTWTYGYTVRKHGLVLTPDFITLYPLNILSLQQGLPGITLRVPISLLEGTIAQN